MCILGQAADAVLRQCSAAWDDHLRIGGVIDWDCRMGDPTIAKDANLWIELFMLSLQKLAKVCKKRNLAFPERIIVVADNASDNKNQDVFCFVSLLIATRFSIVIRFGFLFCFKI